MIEKRLEGVVIDNLKTALSDVTGLQIIGMWQTVGAEEVKAEEEKPSAVLAVKAYPRSYETPTIPYAEIQLEISLAVRSDTDFNGANYLSITEKISDVLQEWQNDFSSLDCFSLLGAFNITGFNLTGGDCGLDKDNCIWQYSQGFTIYGIIEKNN